MEEPKRLNPDVEKEMMDFINSFGTVENFSYEISEDDKQITLIGKTVTTDSDLIIKYIKIIEDILNAKFSSIRSVNGFHYFTYEFL